VGHVGVIGKQELHRYEEQSIQAMPIMKLGDNAKVARPSKILTMVGSCLPVIFKYTVSKYLRVKNGFPV